MKWAILLEQGGPTEAWGVQVPWLDVFTAGDSREHALEMARERILIELLDRMAAERTLFELDYEYLPTLEVIEMPLTTPEAALRQRQAWAAENEAQTPISLAEAAQRYGVSVFALRRAIRTERLWDWQCQHLLAVRPRDVEEWLAERAGAATAEPRRQHSSRFWRRGPTYPRRW